MHYGYLAKKYIDGAKFIMHDRTYDGLEWLGPGQKPSIKLFESFQEEENRHKRIDDKVNKDLEDEVKLRQHQYRHKVLEEIIPKEDKIREENAKLREEIEHLRFKVLEEKEALKNKELMLDCWNEISAAQAIINAECEDYLLKTDFYITREKETGKPIPQEVLVLREEARQRINHGERVYRFSDLLREKELPSKDEIREAIIAGGEELERIRKHCINVHLKYPKPKRQRSY